MTFSYFIIAANPTEPSLQLDTGQISALTGAIRVTPGLVRAELHTPAGVETYHRDGASPMVFLRLEFAALQELEATISQGGYLYQLFSEADWFGQTGTHVVHQVMLTRPFLPLESQNPGTDLCSYLVHYPGAAANLNDWLGHYLRHHPQIMMEYPAVCQINVFTRVDWYDDMPWERVDHMQRNMLSFPSSDALQAALNSPVRGKMRADSESFPAFSGGAIHYPMRTRIFTP
nr:ethyl tert-butyl ether degradation protein EthD [uncultured Cupriavidus sp.]